LQTHSLHPPHNQINTPNLQPQAATPPQPPTPQTVDEGNDPAAASAKGRRKSEKSEAPEDHEEDEELREGKLRFRGGREEAATYDGPDDVRFSGVGGVGGVGGHEGGWEGFGVCTLHRVQAGKEWGSVAKLQSVSTQC